MTVTNSPTGAQVRRETGTIHWFAKTNGVFVSPVGVFDTLVQTDLGEFDLTLKGSKLTQHFSSLGGYLGSSRLTSMKDRNDNEVNLEYDTQGRLANIVDAVGRDTILSYIGNSPLISNITDPLGRTANYGYDINNALSSTTDMNESTVTYGYDTIDGPNHTFYFMTAITTPKGTTTLDYYPPNTGEQPDAPYAIANIVDPLGKLKKYERVNVSGYDDRRITDANGNKTRYVNLMDASSKHNGKVESITYGEGSSIAYTVNYGYDENTGIMNSVEADGQRVVVISNSSGSITNTIDPLGNMFGFFYDGKDNLTQLKDPLNNAYDFDYDTNDNLLSVTDPESGVTSITYDPSGYGLINSLTNAIQNTISFEYDLYGNLVNTTNPLGGQDSYTHDDVGRVVTHTSPLENTTAFSYDGIDRITEILYHDQSTKTLDYGCCGIANVSDPSGTLTFEKDAANRLINTTDVYGNELSYTYYANGNLNTVTYPGSGDETVTYAYDAADRLTSVTDWLGNATLYEYDSGSRLTRTTYPNGSTVLYTYDDANRLTNMVQYTSGGEIIASHIFTMDPLGNRTNVQTYQPLYATPHPQGMTYEYDDDNRLTSAGNKAFGYDANGGLINSTVGGSTTTYTWNRDGMLNSVSYGGSTYTYAYDPLGRRIKKTVNVGGNETVTKYVYDPSGALMAETGITNSVTAYYVYGAGGLISKIIPDTPNDRAYYYHYDGIGSTVAITDSSGAVVNKYAYDTFGAVIDSVEGISNPFKYVGAYGVMDEGNGLLYMRARYYDPAVGRFISKDPIGLAGGINQYAYTLNNPVNYIDPSGLDSLRFNGLFVQWLDDSGLILSTYGAISGGLNGVGRIPTGTYTGQNLRSRTRQGMVCGGSGWSLDLVPSNFSSNRTLLRIHPDQPPRGTAGCIGIACADANRLYSDLRTYLNSGNRSISVEVW